MSHYDDDVRCRKCGAVYDSIRVSESGEERERHVALIEAEGRLCPKHRAKKKPKRTAQGPRIEEVRLVP